ncbi:MAG TPA: ATP-binding protein [Longimicrobium sp.]
MSLRKRIVLTLLLITAILVIPAAIGLSGLFRLQRIAQELRLRDTRAASTLGELRTDLEELRSAQDNFVVIATGDTAVFWRGQADAAARRIGVELDSLAARTEPSPEYRRAVASARRQWRGLAGAVRQEQELIGRGETDAAGTFRQNVVRNAFATMDDAIEPISDALQREGEARVQQAQEVASQIASLALVALAVALALTLLVGFLMTRAMLRPIEELRRGMALVAEGDFEPEVHIPTERSDEIGDLARSFRTMTTQLAELDRLKAEFVSVASHEIKTPLSVIKGYVSLLADGIYGAVSDTQRRTLAAISDQVDRLTRLVHRLLDISRFEAGGGRLEVRRINVRDFLEELTGGFRVLAFQNKVDFTVNVADDVPVNLEGDADRLNEVLGNLLSNAFKFTPSGGRVCLDATRDGTGVVVEVADTGVGIPPSKLPKIFEKFYQVDNDAQPRSVGSGLGLAIAREIVEAHGGTIGAASEVGKGTTFRVVLPERPPAHAAVQPGRTT